MTCCDHAVVVAFAVALTACAAVDRGDRRGAAPDAVLSGARAGLRVDALAVNAVGRYMDLQRRELARVLTSGGKPGQVELEPLPGGVLKLSLAGDPAFAFNSAQVRPDALEKLDRIAVVLLRHDRTVVHIVCHTDASGSDPYNLDLSQRRAVAIAAHLGSRGLPGTRVRAYGRGEREPVADNNTADGRRRNRRIDILIRPVIEGQEQQAWVRPGHPGE